MFWAMELTSNAYMREEEQPHYLMLIAPLLHVY